MERAGRVADYLELGELMAGDALNRKESCGGHFREEYQTEEGEAKRDDENYTYVAAWEFEDSRQMGISTKNNWNLRMLKLAQGVTNNGAEKIESEH